MVARMQKGGIRRGHGDDPDPCGRLVGISCCCDEESAYYIPIAHTEESLTVMEDPDDLTTVTRFRPQRNGAGLLRPFCSDWR